MIYDGKANRIRFVILVCRVQYLVQYCDNNKYRTRSNDQKFRTVESVHASSGADTPLSPFALFGMDWGLVGHLIKTLDHDSPIFVSQLLRRAAISN